MQAGSDQRRSNNNEAMLFRALIVAALTFPAVLLPAAAGENPSDNIAVLKGSSNTQQLITACKNLMPGLFVTARYPSTANQSAATDPALNALTDFLLRGRNTTARISCARWLKSTQFQSMDAAGHWETYSPYADRANAILLQMLENSDPSIRVGAANALWGISRAENGRALLRHASADPNSDVAAASFMNLFWGMQADIAATHDRSAYDNAIARGLQSNYENVVAGALSAYGGLHGVSADATLRRYALDKRAAVRLGAIAAYDALMAYNSSITRFLESRLNDPNIDVRDRVMLELMRMSDVHALPAIEKLARTAPTAAERASASAYAAAIKKETSGTAH